MLVPVRRFGPTFSFTHLVVGVIHVYVCHFVIKLHNVLILLLKITSATDIDSFGLMDPITTIANLLFLFGT